MGAVRRLVPQPDEVLVIDNTPGDAETQLIALQFGVRYCAVAEPGLSRARNRGLKESRCEIAAFVDDDSIPCEDWLEQILAPFADERVASVTGDTIADASLAPALRQRAPRVLSNGDPLWFEIANFGGLGFGTNMSLRKRLCRPERFFDERLGRGAPLWIAEESHAFTSLLAQGHRAVHVPAAIVLHPAKVRDVRKEATVSFAYWLLLLVEFPAHRRDLFRFLFRRLRRQPLSWTRDPHEPGEIINSGLGVKVKSAFAGLLLYLRTRKRRIGS